MTNGKSSKEVPICGKCAFQHIGPHCPNTFSPSKEPGKVAENERAYQEWVGNDNAGEWVPEPETRLPSSEEPSAVATGELPPNKPIGVSKLFIALAKIGLVKDSIPWLADARFAALPLTAVCDCAGMTIIDFTSFPDFPLEMIAIIPGKDVHLVITKQRKEKETP